MAAYGSQVLIFLALNLVASSIASDAPWVATGEKNAALAKEFVYEWTHWSGDADQAAWTKKVSELFAGKLFWAVNLGGLADTSFSMTGTFNEVLARNTAEYPWVAQTAKYGPVSVAIDPKNGGNTILLTGYWQLAAGDGTGHAVPGTEDKFQMFAKLDFSDDHKITSIIWSVDSGALHKMKKSVATPTQLGAGEDVTRLGNFSMTICVFMAGGLFGSLLTHTFSRKDVTQPVLLG